MQDEATWMSQQDAEESAAKERYEYFTRPEPRENMSDIYMIKDKYLGPKTKVREVRIGMTRNAADENRKTVLAYLEPFPHIRIDNAKPLQGWYQSKENESKQSRPRPCFTEAILTEPYGGYCAVGCQFCLTGEALVETVNGPVTISSLFPGDKVLARETYGVVEATVLRTSQRTVSKVFRLTFSNGSAITATPEHPWFVNGKKVQTKNLNVDEQVEAFNAEDPVVQNLWEAYAFSNKSHLLKRVSARGQKAQTSRPAQSSCQGPSPYSRNESVDEPKTQRKTNQSSQRTAKIRRMEAQAGGETPGGQAGVLHFQAKVLHQKGRQDYPLPVRVGMVGVSVPRPMESDLGVRAQSPSARLRSLPARFLGSGVGSIYRSERVLSSTTTGQAGEVSNSIPDTPVDGRDSNGLGHTLLEIQELTGSFEVYDIQTTSENFYVEGLLSSNCYINSGMRGYRGTGLISVPMDYGYQIKEQLSKMRRGAAGYFSSFTDPFTPLENHYHNTQEAAAEFIKVGLPLFFLSRLAYPEWAIDMLCENPHSYAQKSINTCDPVDWRHLSPGAIPLEEHLEEINKIHKRGIYVSIQCNPIVPGVTSNEQILKLFSMLKKAGADHVIVKFVEAAYSWAPAMVERIKKVFGKERGGAFEALFTQNIGSERTVEEGYRLRGHRLFSAHARRIGLTYATCYEYRYEKNPDGSIKNKTGISVGREFTTASQCHGHQVPVYARLREDEKFRPLDECPPSGCLYCADENEEDPGKPRCGDELAGQAPALKYPDLRVPIGDGQGRKWTLPMV